MQSDKLAVCIRRWSDLSTKRYLRDKNADQKRIALNAEIMEANTVSTHIATLLTQRKSPQQVK